MKPKVKTARRSAAKLHGATATYVSIVDRGANETPFTLVKNHKGTPAMSIKKRANPPKTTSKKSHKTVGTSKKDAAVNTATITDMAKLVFSGDNFADEAAVLVKLVEMEWTDDKVTVTKNDDGDFVARIEGSSDDDYLRIEEVSADEEGVTAFVGTKNVAAVEAEGEEADDDKKAMEDGDALNNVENLFKEGEDDGEDGDEGDDEEDDAEADDAEDGDGVEPEVETKAVKPKPAALSKRAQFVKNASAGRTKSQKFDMWDAEWSKGNTLAQTLKAGIEWDGLPPGYTETSIAFSSAMSNIMSDEGLAAGKQAALTKCATDFAQIVGALDGYFDTFISADPSTLEKSFDEGQRKQLNKWAEDFALAISGEEVEAPAVVAKAAPASTDEAVQSIADLIAKAVEPLQQQVKAVNETVEGLASRRPTKKAADPDDGADGRERSNKAAEPAETAAEWQRKKQTKSLMG
jgi:hypothetical protein